MKDSTQHHVNKPQTKPYNNKQPHKSLTNSAPVVNIPPKENKENTDKAYTGPKKSEISSQVDPKAVVHKIVNTEISLPLRQILGTSKELCSTHTKHTPNMLTSVEYAIHYALKLWMSLLLCDEHNTHVDVFSTTSNAIDRP